ncbi:MAG: hypothetical protein V4616_13845 [Bacteroidota bacterium]
MKQAGKYAVIFALVAFILRLLGFYGGLITPETAQQVIFMHMLFILLTVFLSIRQVRIDAGDQPFTIGTQVKAGFKSGGLYSVLTTILVFVYFKFIDVNYFIFKQQELVDQELKANPTVGAVKVKEGVENFFSLMNYCTITLLALMAITFFYTLLIVVLNRYVLRKFE